MATQEEWDRRHMTIAEAVAGFSKDPSTKVGALIVDMDERFVSAGYNGFPRGVRDDASRLADRDTRLKLTLHAEKNAILFAHRDLNGYTLYSTMHPCAQCAAMIAQAGISRVVTHAPTGAFAERWATDLRLAKDIFVEAGVQLEELP